MFTFSCQYNSIVLFDVFISLFLRSLDLQVIVFLAFPLQLFLCRLDFFSGRIRPNLFDAVLIRRYHLLSLLSYNVNLAFI